VYIKEDYLNLR